MLTFFLREDKVDFENLLRENRDSCCPLFAQLLIRPAATNKHDLRWHRGELEGCTSSGSRRPTTTRPWCSPTPSPTASTRPGSVRLIRRPAARYSSMVLASMISDGIDETRQHVPRPAACPGIHLKQPNRSQETVQPGYSREKAPLERSIYHAHQNGWLTVHFF